MAKSRSDAVQAVKAAYEAYTLSKLATKRLKGDFVKAVEVAIKAGVTQIEIGKLVNLSRQRISQMLRERD